MLESFRGRVVTKGQLVEVYFNLHRKMWSIRDARSKLVLGHTDNLLILSDVSFVVNEGGRQRVLRERKKNVHAFARGRFFSTLNIGGMVTDQTYTKVSYNPFKAGTFVNALTDSAIPDTMQFDWAYLINKSVYAKNTEGTR